MHYVYILKKRKDGEIYIGCTNNLKSLVMTKKVRGEESPGFKGQDVS